MTRNELRDQAMMSEHRPEVVLGPERPGSNSRLILVIVLLVVAAFLLLQMTGGSGASPSPSPSPLITNLGFV